MKVLRTSCGFENRNGITNTLRIYDCRFTNDRPDHGTFHEMPIESGIGAIIDYHILLVYTTSFFIGFLVETKKKPYICTQQFSEM